MYDPKVEIEMAIQYLVLARDKCHSLEDVVEEITFTTNLFQKFSQIMRELDNHKKWITEENNE